MRPLLVLALVVGLTGVLGWMACVRRDKVAPRGQELVFDDFGFSVENVRRAKSLGPPGRETRAGGTFWIVDLRVANHAKRVGYEMDSHQAAIVDAEGNRFDPSPAGQGALAAEGGAIEPVSEIGHGESCVTRLVFDLPLEAAEPGLKIRFGNVGSALDFLLLGDWSLELDSR